MFSDLRTVSISPKMKPVTRARPAEGEAQMTAPAETRRNLWRKSSRMVARSDPAHRSDICLKRPGWTGEARTRAVLNPRSLCQPDTRRMATSIRWWLLGTVAPERRHIYRLVLPGINPIKWCFFASGLTATADCYRLARSKGRHGGSK